MTQPPFEEALAPDPGEEPDDLTGRVTSGAGWTAAANLASQAAQLFSTIVLVRLLVPADYGLATVVWFVTGFAALFTQLGIGPAIVHRRRLDQDYLNAGFWANMVTGIGLTLLIAALAPLIAAIYDEPDLTGLLLIASLAFTVNAAVVPAAMLERRFQFRSLALAEGGSRIVGWLAAIAFAYAGFGASSLVLGPMISFALTTILLFALVRWRPRGFGSKDSYRSLWRYGRGVTGYTITDFFAHQSDSLLVPLVASPTNVGYYNRAYNLMTMPVSQVGGTLGRVLLPALAAVRDDPERLRRGIRRSVLVVCAIAFPVAGGLLATANDLIPVLFGDQWLDAVILVQILSAASFPQIAETPLRSVFTATGETGQLFKYGLVQCLLSVLAVVVGLPWGVQGVAIAILIRQWAGLPLSLGWPMRIVNQPLWPLVRTLIGPTVAVTAMILSVLCVGRLTADWSQVSRLAAEVATGVVVYPIALRVGSPAAMSEIIGIVRRRGR